MLTKGLILFFALISGIAVAQDYPAYTSAAALQKMVEVLASDSLEGRETGEAGQKKAASYITAQLADFVIPGRDSLFLQPFNLYEQKTRTASLNINNKDIVFKDEFIYYPANKDFTVQGKEIIFVKAGADKDDLEDLKLKGKIAAIGGEPGKEAFKEMVEAVMKEKPLAVLVRVPDLAGKSERYRHTLEKGSISIYNTEVTAKTPVIYVDDNTWQSVTALKECELKGKGKLELSFEAGTTKRALTGDNVIAYFPGTIDEVVVISAHYDHLGSRDGQIFYGADDNASGTAGIIAIAQSLAEIIHAPGYQGRGLLFIAFSGEEKGLLGSSYYVTNPFIPLEKTYVNVNTDMIGRIDKEHAGDTSYIYVIGADRISQDLHDLLVTVNESSVNLDLDFKYNDPKDPNRYYYRSDHYNFAKNDIPVAFFFNGVHADYHKLTDTKEKIVPKAMELRVKLAFKLTYALLTRKEPLRKN